MSDSGKVTTDLLESLGLTFLHGPTHLGKALDQTGNFIIYNSASAFSGTVKGASMAADRALTVPDPGADASFVMTGTAAQTINGKLAFKGTTTNDSAAAGFVGEYIESVMSATDFPATGVIGDLTSISLTAGDWDVSLGILTSANGATVTSVLFGATVTPGNSSTGFVDGSNETYAYVPTVANPGGGSLAGIRFSLAGTTTVYFKYQAAYSVAQPKASGRISARRVR